MRPRLWATFRVCPIAQKRGVSVRTFGPLPFNSPWSRRQTAWLPSGAANPAVGPSRIARTARLYAMSSEKVLDNGVPVRKPVLFFDIDNCLYARSTRIQELMARNIDRYFARHLSLTEEDAIKLHRDYYRNYGLALEGLVRHHQIDPLEYNSKVDDALPLEDILKPDPDLRRFLEDIDRDKVTPWLFTNAYVNHGRRVVRLLGVEDLFDGLTYCDYAQYPLVCKPSKEMYLKAMREAGAQRPEDCYFVDDSYLNCQKAEEYGWTVAHLVEEDIPLPVTPACKYQIRHLRELRTIFPQFFKSTQSQASGNGLLG